MRGMNVRKQRRVCVSRTQQKRMAFCYGSLGQRPACVRVAGGFGGTKTTLISRQPVVFTEGRRQGGKDSAPSSLSGEVGENLVVRLHWLLFSWI